MVQRKRGQRKTRMGRPKHFIRTVQRVEMGIPITPSPDPPAWTAAPWWPFTIATPCIANTIYTIEVIHNFLLVSLGMGAMNPAPNFRIRMVEVRIWGLNKQPICLSIPRLTATNARLKQISDRGSPLRYSRIGWRYGMDSQVSLAHDSKIEAFSVVGASQTDNILIYIQVLVQCMSALTTLSKALMDLSEPDISVKLSEAMNI